VSAEVELLREAAKTMRERAQSAEPGPWVTERPGHGKAWINTPGYEHAWGMHGFVEEARHVASWHPAVALAVADWLDVEAQVHDDLVTADAGVRVATDNRWHIRLDASTLPQALAVARAYLARES
jgi:hypothetical protein